MPSEVYAKIACSRGYKSARFYQRGVAHWRSRYAAAADERARMNGDGEGRVAKQRQTCVVKRYARLLATNEGQLRELTAAIARHEQSG